MQEQLDQIESFRNAINKLCIEYKIAICPEDNSADFVFQKYSKKTMKWLNRAYISSLNPPVVKQKYGKIVK